MRSSFEPLPLPGAEAGFVPRSLEAPPESALPLGAEDPASSEALSRGDGLETAIAAHTEATAALRAALVSLTAQAEQLRSDAAAAERQRLGEALELAFALARRLVERELAVDPQGFVPWIERAAALIVEEGPVTLCVSPELSLLLEAELPGELEALRASQSLDLVEDATLAAGEARVRAGAAQVDVTVEDMLALLRDELRTHGGAVAEEELSP